MPAFYSVVINLCNKVLEGLVSSLQFTVFRLAFLESYELPSDLSLWLIPWHGCQWTLCGETWLLAQEGCVSQGWYSCTELSSSSSAGLTYMAVCRAASEPSGADRPERRRRRLAHVFSSVLRMLLRKAVQPTCRLGMLEIKTQIFFKLLTP